MGLVIGDVQIELMADVVGIDPTSQSLHRLGVLFGVRDVRPQQAVEDLVPVREDLYSDGAEIPARAVIAPSSPPTPSAPMSSAVAARILATVSLLGPEPAGGAAGSSRSRVPSPCSRP